MNFVSQLLRGKLVSLCLTAQSCHIGIITVGSVMLILSGLLLSPPTWARAQPAGSEGREGTLGEESQAAADLHPPGTVHPLRIGRIDIIVADIYKPEEIDAVNGLLRTLRRGMNGLHIETRQYVLRRELLFRTDDPYDPALLEETARNLRNLGFLNNVHVVPVDTLPDGAVDVEVHVQETWSLKAEFAYALSSEGDQRWAVSLADDNLFGHGWQVGFSVGEDEDFRFHQFFFEKQRLLGTRWRLRGSTARRSDGYADRVRLERPFYAQNDAWGLELNASRVLADRRYYLSNAGPAGNDPTQTQSQYALIPQNSDGFSATVLARISHREAQRVWRIGGGFSVSQLEYRIDEPGYELSDGRIVDLRFLSSDGSPAVRENGTTIFPYLDLSTESRRWTSTRFLQQYGPVEDVSLAPQVRVRAGISGPKTGSTSGYGQRVLADYYFEDWSRLANGFLLVQSIGEASLGESRDRWSSLDFLVGWVGRHNENRYRRQTRIFAEVARGEKLVGTSAYVLGLNRGLRTLGFDGMAGDRLIRWNFEHNLILPGEVLGFFQGGLAAFYDGGMAWWQNEIRSSDDIRHEAGIGIRFGSTRSARGEMARIDVTWPLNAAGGPVFTAVTRGLF